MYSTTQAMHTICAQGFAGCMFCECPVGEDFHDFISSKVPYILLCLKISQAVCVGYNCSNHTAAGCAYMCLVTVALENTLIGMSTLYLRRCALAAFTSTSKRGQLR